MNRAIEVADLQYRYPDGTAALRGVTFSVGEGERVGLVGPNGSGKSTLLLHLNGILPDEGEPRGITVHGSPVTRETVRSVRREVGLLFQDPDDQLFCPTVYEDVAFGPQQFGLEVREVESAVHEALALTSLAGYERRAPHHLSSGEKRRVCLAGVLACRPRVLVLDEPTSNLDPRGKRQLIETLKGLKATMIIAPHDLEMVVELCARTILLDKGRVIADGRTEDLLADEPLMLAHGLEKPHILRHSHPH